MIRPLTANPPVSNHFPPVTFSLSLLRIATLGQPEPPQARELEALLDRELIHK